MIQTHCPDADRLRALITDPELPDYADLETHLAHCSRCQARLDEIAIGDSGWLKDAGRLASGARTDPELTKTLHRLHDFGLDDSHVPPISLDFLTPSSQPGLLGTLGRYQVLDVIGRGAMGIVLKGIDPDLLRPVAIKVLAPYLASSGTARQRFLREARAAAAVSHDHIVTIHAVEPGELPYIVMEFISGISLQARLDRDGPLPPRDIARIGHQAACGLAAAHAVGLVHRDIKPANILLENGVERVKITDFGLARAADDARLTQSGTAAGTPLYMSPEQTRGETVDQRSDLFSLGSVLYTLATGFPPFRAGSTMGVLNRIANDPPRPIRETVPDFPAALEAIIMQFLEKDPAKRFQVAADVSVKLTGYLNDPQAEPRRPRHRLPKWWESSLPILAGILVLGTVLYFKTRHGTLVVETDDPSVSVRIDGDELNITGAGPQVVSLRPGVYQVHAADVYGKSVAVEPQVVTIERNGKQIVKVTVQPNPAPAAVGTNPKDVPGPVPVRKDSPKADPEWGPRLDELMNRYQNLAAALAGTSAGPVMSLPGPVKDLDKAVAGLKEAEREPVKRLLVLRDQFGLIVPQVQKVATKLAELRGRAPAAELEQFEAGLRTQYDALATALNDMEKLATQLGVKPSAIDPTHTGVAKKDPDWHPRPADTDWDARYKKLADEGEALLDHAGKTTIGRVLTVSEKERQTILAGLAGDDAKRAQRLLYLRDEFAKVTPEFRKAIGPWEQARLAARTARIKEEAGAIPPTDREKAELTLKDAERTLTAAEKALEKVLTELRPLVKELKATRPEDTDEAEFKKIMAEYDALTLRLVNTPTGRVLALIGVDAPDDSQLREAAVNDAAAMTTARKLLSIRFKIRGQKFDAEGYLNNLRRAAESGGQTPPADLQGLKLRNAALRGLVDDVKTIADELDPPPTVDSEFKKVMADYDALVLRLAKTKVGRALALFPSGKSWTSDQFSQAFPNPYDLGQAKGLLDKRGQILAQVDAVEKALSARYSAQRLLKDEPDRFAKAADRASIDELIGKHEHDAKVAATALRTLVDDLKKMADEIDPPKGK
jgi:serine/threonine protein kinase